MPYMVDRYTGPDRGLLTMPGVVGGSFYISRTQGKCVTRSMVDAAFALNRTVNLNFEQSSTGPLNGAGQGNSDATFALNVTRSVRGPKGIADLFSYDYPYLDSRWPATKAYATEVARLVRGAGYLAGGYGDYTTTKRLRDLGLIDVQWQTSAWSNGAKDPRAHMYQHIYTPGYDLSDVTGPFWGAWTRTGAQTNPAKPKPKPASLPAQPVQEDDMQLLYGPVPNGAHLLSVGGAVLLIRDAQTEVDAIRAGTKKFQFHNAKTWAALVAAAK